MRDLLALLIFVAACYSANGLVNTTLPVVAVSNSVAGTSAAACQPQNPMLNALLLQLLLSSLQQTTQQQQQAAFFNQFVNPTPPLLTPRTTLITSSVRRTVTDFFSTPVAFWLRNQRITSTLVSSTVREFTELVTVTSTLDNLLVRSKRQPELEDSYNEGADSHLENAEMEVKIKSVLRKPAVQEAWLRFYNLLVEELGY